MTNNTGMLSFVQFLVVNTIGHSFLRPVNFMISVLFLNIVKFILLRIRSTIIIVYRAMHLIIIA